MLSATAHSKQPTIDAIFDPPQFSLYTAFKNPQWTDLPDNNWDVFNIVIACSLFSILNVNVLGDSKLRMF
jgi:hypothetical protein